MHSTGLGGLIHVEDVLSRCAGSRHALSMVISCPPSMQLLTELCVCFSSVVSLPAGSFKIISRNGRLEKSVDAHRGACISLRWSYDGEVIKSDGHNPPACLCPRSGNQFSPSLPLGAAFAARLPEARTATSRALPSSPVM